MSPLFYAVGASEKAIKTFATAKVRIIFEICKKICTFGADLLKFIG